MFAKILIANRGEIACRVIATARRLGFVTVAIYSDADTCARHVQLADEAWPVGPAPARQSYLAQEKILDVAHRSGAQAIHPGYGFLSENADFAAACADAGVTFIGPPPSAIRAMGSKAESKALMARYGVPLVPGYHGEAQDLATLKRAAFEIGYPVLIKASAGGGGKGMRVVRSDDELEAALEGAKREALASFGDDRVLIEKYLMRPRHIEIQVFADTQGDCVSLFERDCSIQRRHQKVIEEAPAPGVSVEMRKAMSEAAIAAARAVNYVGAGTVEFIVEDGAFYFMEMNTRLQVEHPVTEMVTGLDLVEWQLRVAAGEPLPVAAGELGLRGHAIEARVYAEDPQRDFLPSIGVLNHLRQPREKPGEVRVDTGVSQNDGITPYYDPMIAKLIVWGPDRPAAVRRLAAALAEYEVTGVTTNLGLLRAIATHPAYAAASLDTGFIVRHGVQLFADKDAGQGIDIVAVTAATLAVANDEREKAAAAADATEDPCSPWAQADGWRSNGRGRLEIHFRRKEAPDCVVTAQALTGGSFLIDVLGETFEGSLNEIGPEPHLLIDGVRRRVQVIRHEAEVTVIREGRNVTWIRDDPLAPPRGEVAASERVTATIPGRVVRVLVRAGDLVEKNDPLIVIEAMKMELTFTSPRAGAISDVRFAIDQMVDEGSEMITFEP